MISPWELLSLESDHFYLEETWIKLIISRRGNKVSLHVECKGYFYWGFNHLASDKGISYWLMAISNELFEKRHPKAKQFFNLIQDVLRFRTQSVHYHSR